MQLDFVKETARVVVEFAERCPNKRMIWTVLQNKRVRNQTSTQVAFTLYDPGINNNGKHFIKATSYNNRGELMGWRIEDILITGFGQNPGPSGTARTCQ